MATEEILMAAVKAGGDRQELHERIRQHSQAAAEQVKLHGKPNDLIDRLSGDSSFRSVDLARLLDPTQFVGRAPAQVTEFIRQVVEPLRQRYRSALAQRVDLRV
jgi:adenylosuccinate lyase